MLDDHEQLEMPAQVVGDASGRAQPGAQPTPKVMDRSPQAGVQPKRDPRRRFLVAIAALLALGTGTYFGASWWTTGRSHSVKATATTSCARQAHSPTWGSST